MVSIHPPDIMFDRDLRINEKRWRRKRLFRAHRPHPAPRILAGLVVLVALFMLGAWLEIPLFDHLTTGLWQ